MTPLHFKPAAVLWPLVDRAFQEHSRAIRALLPDAEVEHAGATAIPGSLTRGDLDLLVRVPASIFAAAAKALEDRYEIDQPDNWTPSFASFAERSGTLSVGVQLVSAGSDVDVAFVSLRALLRKRPDLVDRVNGMKRAFDGGDPQAYAAAKDELYTRMLREEC